MIARFADTSYFLALLIPNDVNHGRALALANELRAPLITSDWVLVEIGNHLSPERSRQVFVRFLRSIEAEPQITVVPASRDLLQRGLRLYESRTDKAWSVTDCISFVVMKEQTLSEALSSDHHFEQAGFKILLP